MTVAISRLLDLEPAEYHQHPGFSSTSAKTLIAKSPLHAWQQHQAYGGKAKTPTKSMDRGTAGHTMLLGKGSRIACLSFDDWKTKAARESRDKTRAAGLVPILHEDYTAAEELADAVRAKLAQEAALSLRVPDKLDGISEQAMQWVEQTASGQVLCRGMMDHVWLWPSVEQPTTARILDLKFVEDASPRAVERASENMGYAIQAAAYTTGLAKVYPHLAGKIEFLLLFIEVEPPYAINLVEPDGIFEEIGQRRWRRAVETWGKCLKEKHWPAYGAGIKRISAPPWALNNEEMLADGT